MKRLLLLSNSTDFGRGYLDHAIEAVRAHFAGVGRIAFVPFALKDQAGYWAKVRDRLEAERIEVTRVTPDPCGYKVVESADGVFVGGGNTFRLLRALRHSGLIELLRSLALQGMPYMGASAGTNVAAPTIKTTNDMPIVEAGALDALDLVPFQINPHFVDVEGPRRHMGETREERLREYLEENALPVVGLREGAWLKVLGDRVRLEGANGARIFRRGMSPSEWPEGTELTTRLEAAP